MLLTSLLDSVSIFSIRLENKGLGSVLVANVTAHTTGELLLENYQKCIGCGSGIFSYVLVYNDKDIQLSDTFKELGIKEGDLIELLYNEGINSKRLYKRESNFTPDKPRSLMTIYLKTPTGKTELKVYWSDTIIQIKEMIHDLVGISPQKQMLTFNDVELIDNYTLSYYNIQKGSTLYMTSKETLIYIRALTGETIKHDSTSDETIHKIKLMIKDKKNIPPIMQRITFNGNELDDYCTLSSYEIKNESMIYLEIKSMIFVKKNDGLIINLEAETKETIGQIKEKIQDKEGIPLDQQSLFF
ncbi:13813_t:CDS:2 [Acaulospora morrowiae]|uniref:13813_t:CDS:1 n=1 Tax=Acaulospora morrowiae TaxID=94023 RepID=A0A9N9CKR4_9GLOM|nr:13813_t:CDS:2 [Acaulospora morrowiae]